MLERTVCFSGPSGTGKTTLISELIRLNPVYISGNPEKLDRAGHVREKADTEKAYSETFLYAKSKINERIRDAGAHAELELLNQGKIILGDRCQHDTTAYINAALRYGDLTEDEVRELLEYQEETHPFQLRPQDVVYIAFPLKNLQKYLKQRWKSEGQGFRETDVEYLSIVSQCFDEHFQDPIAFLSITDPKKMNVQEINKAIIQRIQSKQKGI